jgi:large subunit ribosomal protein L9
MQVILIQPVEKLGRPGEVVNVAGGYGRNYLIPRKKALRATKANMAFFEEQKAIIEQENQDKMQTAEAIAGKIEGLSVTVVRQAADDGRLYGSVTSRDIALAIKDASNMEISYDQIVLNTKFKEIGSYEVIITLHADVKAKIVLNIARTDATQALAE